MVAVDLHSAHQASQPESTSVAETAAIWRRSARQFGLPASEQSNQAGTLRMAGAVHSKVRWRSFLGQRPIYRQPFDATAGRALYGSARPRLPAIDSRTRKADFRRAFQARIRSNKPVKGAVQGNRGD